MLHRVQSFKVQQSNKLTAEMGPPAIDGMIRHDGWSFNEDARIREALTV
jgi:hypothetical protein